MVLYNACCTAEAAAGLGYIASVNPKLRGFGNLNLVVMLVIIVLIATAICYFVAKMARGQFSALGCIWRLFWSFSAPFCVFCQTPKTLIPAKVEKRVVLDAILFS